jgi:hypothetical protein
VASSIRQALGAGQQIEAHDHVFRLNGHNAPGSGTLLSQDLGHRTEFRGLSSAAVTGGAPTVFRCLPHHINIWFILKRSSSPMALTW